MWQNVKRCKSCVAVELHQTTVREQLSAHQLHVSGAQSKRHSTSHNRKISVGVSVLSVECEQCQLKSPVLHEISPPRCEGCLVLHDESSCYLSSCFHKRQTKLNWSAFYLTEFPRGKQFIFRSKKLKGYEQKYLYIHMDMSTSGKSVTSNTTNWRNRPPLRRRFLRGILGTECEFH